MVAVHLGRAYHACALFMGGRRRREDETAASRIQLRRMVFLQLVEGLEAMDGGVLFVGWVWSLYRMRSDIICR